MVSSKPAVFGSRFIHRVFFFVITQQLHNETPDRDFQSCYDIHNGREGENVAREVQCISQGP